MFKLMHKKLNKKGFTLAELLVVVAIVAILVAIAIPIFTESLKEAQIRTNEANLRTTRAAAVEHILANWNKLEKPGSGAGANNRYYREGASKTLSSGTTAPGWYAIGVVDAAGNLQAVHVRVNLDGISSKNEVGADVPEGIATENITSSSTFPTADKITPVEKSGNLSPLYYTLVKITDTDIKAG